MSEPVIRLTGLTRSFEQGGVKIDVLRGVNLTIMLARDISALHPKSVFVVDVKSTGLFMSIECCGNCASATFSNSARAMFACSINRL